VSAPASSFGGCSFVGGLQIPASGAPLELEEAEPLELEDEAVPLELELEVPPLELDELDELDELEELPLVSPPLPPPAPPLDPLHAPMLAPTRVPITPATTKWIRFTSSRSFLGPLAAARAGNWRAGSRIVPRAAASARMGAWASLGRMRSPSARSLPLQVSFVGRTSSGAVDRLRPSRGFWCMSISL
jgi:hypothetical protein